MIWGAVERFVLGHESRLIFGEDCIGFCVAVSLRTEFEVRIEV